VLVISEGERLGTMPVPEALVLARDRGLDLVEVAPNEVPPVCRILNYGKLRYLYSKKEREAKKSQKNTALREVRFRPKIGKHDFSSKVRKVRELLGDGSKVKVAVVFRGREVTHPELGVTLLKRVADEVQDDSRLEKPPGMEGRAISIILVPAKQKAEKKVAVENAQTEDSQGS
jgi:translation initiation factor IF-3